MKKIPLLSSFVFLLLFNLSLIAQRSGPSSGEMSAVDFYGDGQMQGAALDSLVTWQEQVLLHMDKSVVGPKEPIFFKAYVLTGPDQLRVSASNVLKVELLDRDGTLVGSQYHKIVDGAVSGSFTVPKKTKSGSHYFRAYTRWMLNYGPENFALKEIEVKGRKPVSEALVPEDGNVSIFPEGANLVAGLENRVVVRYKNMGDLPIRVVDASGNKVADVKDFGIDVGTFLITPEKGKTYSLQIGQGKKVALPQVADMGYALRLNNISDDKIVAKMTTSDQLKDEKIYLRGRINGINFFESKVDFKDVDVVEIDIPKAELPNGILRLQLEDEFDQIWATRPLHIDNQQLHIEVDEQLKNEGRFLKVKVSDTEGMPITTELSVGLTKEDADAKGTAIGESERNRRFMNDLLVSTGQLPDYALDKISELPSEIRYDFQKGLEFYGRAYDLNNVLLSDTKIQIVITSQDDAIAKEVMTNKEGNFFLSGLQVKGDAQMVFRTTNEDSTTRLVKVIPLDYEVPPLKAEEKELKRYGPPKAIKAFEQEGLIALEGVTLTEEKIRARSMPPVYGIKPRKSVVQDPERPKLMSELFLQLPGVIIGGDVDAPTISSISRGAGSGAGGQAPNTFGSVLDQQGPLWVVDGFNYGNSPGVDPSWGLSAIDIDRIEFIDPYSGDASMWGSRGAFGVVLIYTRNGSDEDYEDRKEAQLAYNGFHQSLNFDEYVQSLDSKKEIARNSTLYWNPTLKTDENGEVLIELPQLAEQKELTLDIKAITQDGKSGSFKMSLIP